MRYYPLLRLALVLNTIVPVVSFAALPVGPQVGDQDLSPFYRWNGALPDKPGVMLREEPMKHQPEIAAAQSRRILYTSRDVRWDAGIVPVSGTLYFPQGKPPSGGWPLVAWAHGTLGVADTCAPSWTGHAPRDASYINKWLQQGFAVVATDYQGLGGPGPHPYLIWQAEGRSVLDSVRAALQAHPQQLANRLVITGQSQGSGASLGASYIAPGYAPELKLLATIATGLVATFPDGPVAAGDGRIHGTPPRLEMLRLIGGSLADDAPAPESLVTDSGAKLLARARVSCMPELGHVQRRLHLNANNAFIGGSERITSVLKPVTDMPSARFTAPLFLATGLADRTLSPYHQYAAVAALCAAGNPLEWKTYQGITHNGIVNTAFADELTFVQAVLAGKPRPDSCGTLVVPGKAQPALKDILYNN
ncbi:lipase family protein [Phytobacter diazotrophicus]|uniref:lipase family protein n=1 Tax=Phytobacter diazotrophicus TaxID=395631 RepID=UPI001CC47AE7|nr:lipase family protein [Phytobacter diazotrophicus]